MAAYNEQSDYIHQGDKPTSTYNAQQDDSGFKGRNETPNSSSGYGDSESGVGGPKSGFKERNETPNSSSGYGDSDSGVGGPKSGFRERNETPNSSSGYGDSDSGVGGPKSGFRERNETPNSSSGYGDSDSGVGGPKSGYGDLMEGGTFDQGTSEQTQFGLEGKTGRYGREGADPQWGETMGSRSYDTPVDPMDSNFDKAPHGVESVPAGDGWGAEDTSPVHGAKKDGLINRIKQMLPGQHHTADGGITHSHPNAPPKKSLMEKVKETLPGQHGSSDAGT